MPKIVWTSMKETNRSLSWELIEWRMAHKDGKGCHQRIGVAAPIAETPKRGDQSTTNGREHHREGETFFFA